MMRFGTDGIRGRAGVFPVDTHGATRMGQAAARLAAGQPVVVAWDRRPSSDGLAQAVVAGAQRAGAHVREAGVLPTAGLSEVLARGLGGAGVMVTASHNPAADNGFKLLGAGGAKLSDADAAKVEGWLIEELPCDVVPGDVSSCADEALRAHAAALASRVDLTPLVGQCLGLDLAHGAGVALEPWLQTLGVHWVVVGDGSGIENDGVGAVHPERLGRAVREAGARAGLAVDGDADRCVLVDEQGRTIHGDVLAWWLSRQFGEAGLAVTVMSTHALEASLDGLRVVRTPVGDRHLAAAMTEHALGLGVEESGHALFADGLPTGCGLLTGLRAISALLRTERPVSEQLAGFVPWPRATARVPVESRTPLSEVDSLVHAVREAEVRLDGGRTLLRYSGTEPVLRILAEGQDAAVVREVVRELERVASEALG